MEDKIISCSTCIKFDVCAYSLEMMRHVGHIKDIKFNNNKRLFTNVAVTCNEYISKEKSE